MKPVIIAEKPSQARSYAEAFKMVKREKTFIEIDKCSTFPDGAYITWGIGHLVEQKLPNELNDPIDSWMLENLPIIREAEYKIGKDKQVQFNSVKKLCQQTDLIINACDCDREGSNIFYLILEYANIKNKQIKRLWINSLEKESVIKGFNNLQGTEKDYLMYQEAKARMISDYLIGMNLSPLYTLKLKNLGLTDSVFGIGRVQTPTLYMIYLRHLEIENFVEKDFYEIHAEFHKGEQKYKGKMKLKEEDKTSVDNILQDISSEKSGIIKDIKKEVKTQDAPALHSLSTLQSKINRKYKYSPKKVLEIAQSLYEKKVVTYPRTDTNFITDGEFDYLKGNIDNYIKIFNLNHKITYMEPRKKYVDSIKVQEHYAIILTKSVNKTAVEKLSEEELNVFKEIYNTTMAIFLEDYTYEVTDVITTIKDKEFYSSGKVDRKLGWKALDSENGEEEKEKEEKLPQLNPGDQVEAKPFIHQGKTKPPSLYTQGQLIPMMKTCGKFLEDKEDLTLLNDISGIGTEATRAEVIEKLQRHQYIEIKKNKVYITKKGILLCVAVTGTLLSSPEMTAKWEKSLNLISKGNSTLEKFLGNIEKYITHQVASVDQELAKNGVSKLISEVNTVNEIAKCPKCKSGSITEKITKTKKRIYACQKSDCDFIIFGEAFGKTLNKSVIEELLKNGKTKDTVKGFKSKAGKKYDAFLVLSEDHKVKLDFMK